jgi:ankyrin repeat protein
MLLEAGAKVDPVDVFGNTPLWRSVMNSTSDLGAIKELLKHGADPSIKNNHGRAPIDIARDTRRDDIIALFKGKE